VTSTRGSLGLSRGESGDWWGLLSVESVKTSGAAVKIWHTVCVVKDISCIDGGAPREGAGRGSRGRLDREAAGDERASRKKSAPV
jgi:hypothetical protein